MRDLRLLAYVCLSVLMMIAFPSRADPPYNREAYASTMAYPKIGFTITHTRVAAEPEKLCAFHGGAGAISGRDAVIAHYEDPAVRSVVITDLAAQRKAGASVVRTVLWFGPGADVDLARNTQSNDPLALMMVDGGKLPNRADKNLVQFAEDAHDLGYTQLIIAFGNEGRSNPTCRGRDIWGACYDSSYDEQTWSAMEQMIAAVNSVRLPELTIYYEIAGEACFHHDPNSLLQRNLEHYARYMTERYQRAFGDSHFIVSCIAGDPQRLRDSAAFFRELDPKPAFLDMHMYLTDTGQIAQTLSDAETTAESLKIPMQIGETFADNQTLFSTIGQLRSRGALGSLRNILVWPRTAHSSCQMDVAPGDVLRWIHTLAQP